MQTESLVDDGVEVVEILELLIGDVALGSDTRDDLFAHFGDVLWIQSELVEDEGQSRGCSITARLSVKSSFENSDTNLPATMTSCESPRNIWSSAPVG